METSGVYQIVNIVNGRKYIGSSKNIEKRFEEHRKNLKTNKHINIILQRSYNKYGENSFIYEIVEECELDKLFEFEQKYLDTETNLFNIGKKASGGDNLSNHPNKLNIINRMKISLNEKMKKLSIEEKKTIWGKNGKENPNFNNKWTEEQRKLASDRLIEYYKNHEQAIKGKTIEEFYGEEKAKEVKKKLSDFAKNRTGEKNPFFNKKHSDETLKKMSEIKKGKYKGSQNIPFEIDGVIYNSLGEASKELNIHITTIRWRLNSKNKKFENYKYV